MSLTALCLADEKLSVLELERTFQLDARGVTACAWSPDGATLAVAAYKSSGTCEVYFWNATSGKKLATHSLEAPSVLDMSFTRDGHWLAVGCAAMAFDVETLPSWVFLIATPTGKPQQVVRNVPTSSGFEHPGVFFSVSSVDGLLAVDSFQPKSRRRTVRIEELPGRAPVATFRQSEDDSPHYPLAEHAISGNRSLLAVAALGAKDSPAQKRGNVKIWQADNSEPVATLTEVGPVHSLSFSPDDRILATGNEDGVVKFWDVGTYKERMSIKADDAESPHVLRLHFRPSGDLIMTGSYGEVKLWDVSRGHLVARLAPGAGYRPPIRSFSFSPDGTRFPSSWRVTESKVEINIWRVMEQ